MNIKLFFQALFKFILGFLIVSLLLFIPANTILYWNAWLFIGLLFIPMFIAGIILFFKNPKLLELRLNVKEKEQEQKIVIIISSLIFTIGFILAGLNFRYKWDYLPNIIIIISSIIFIISYILYAIVLVENKYLSRTIKVMDNQKVIDKGLYKIVRHPMYTATIFLFLSIPLILGSLLSFIIFLAYPFLLVKRINNEEKVLEEELKGYKKYKQKVKYKLLPFIW